MRCRSGPRIVSRTAAAFAIAITILQLCVPTSTLALPADGKVVAGQATIHHTTPTSLGIQQATDKAILNWNSFSIAANEAVRFYQPSISSIALNRVTGIDPSVILGQLQANGRLFLINPNGILFGAGSQINVGGLLASTLQIKDSDFMAGRYLFAQDPLKGLSTVINKGTIHVSDHGFVYLIAPGVANDGVILANLGSVVLGSAQKATIDLMGDGLINYALSDKVASQVMGPDGKPLTSAVSNSGTIQADGGKVILAAKASGDVFESVINQSGVIRATSLVNHGGVIRLEGGDPVQNTGVLGWNNHLGEVKNADGRVLNTGTLDVSAAEPGAAPGEVTLSGQMVGVAGSVLARGADHAAGGNVLATSSEKTIVATDAVIDTSGVGNSSAGNTVVWSDHMTAFRGTILAKGGETGGNGGQLETSGHELLEFTGKVNALAPHGTTGSVLLDPTNITVANGGTATLAQVDQFADPDCVAGGCTIAPATINPAAATVNLQADNDITITDPLAMTGAGIGITMRAGRDINVNNGVSTSNGAISMTANDAGAGVGRAAGTGDITGAGNINAGSGALNLTIGTNAGGAGNINLTGTVVSSGTTTLNAGATGDISLANVNNDFNTINITNGRNVTIYDTTGGMTIAAATTTGNLTLTSDDGLTIGGAVNTGGGTFAGTINNDGGTVGDFVMNAGSSITTTNTSATAVVITANVNPDPSPGQNDRGIILGNITTGNGGTITALTNPGGITTGASIDQIAGTVLNTGSGSVVLSTSTSGTQHIGTAAAPIQTTAGTVTASTGTGGVFIHETDGANMTATALGAGTVYLGTDSGTLTVAGATSSVSGAITLDGGVAGNIAVNNAVTTTGIVRITAPGGTVSETGTITAGSLGVRALGPVTLNGANNVATVAGTVTGVGNAFSYNDADALTIGSVAALVAPPLAFAAVDGVSTNNGAVTVTTTNGTLTVSNTAAALDVNAGTGTVSLTSGGTNNLTITGAVTGTGGVTYTSDSMALTGATNAGGNIATLQPNTAGRAVNLGGGGALSLTSAELDTITAGTLRVGRANSGNLTIQGPIAPAGTNTLSLISGGTITQGGGNTITETNLSVNAVNAVTLTQANAVTTFSGTVSTAGQALQFTDANGFTVGTVDGIVGVTTNNANAALIANAGNIIIDNNITVGTGNVGIQATAGTISQNAGDVITAAGLTVRSQGAITLNEANDVDTLAGNISGAGNAFQFTDSDGLTIGTMAAVGGVAATNGISTTNGPITVLATNGPITVANTAAAQDVNAGTSTVALTAGGANQLLTVTGAVTGTGGVTYTADNMTLTGATTATGAIATLQPNTGGQLVNLGGADAGGTLGLTDAELDTVAAGTLRVGRANSGNMIISASLTPAGATTLSLISGSNVTENAGATITETNLAINAVGSVTLNEANNLTTIAANVTGAGNAFSYTDADALAVGSVDGINGVTD